MKTITLVAAGLAFPERETLLKLEAADEYPRTSLFYEELNSDRLDERFLERAPEGRRIVYNALPQMATQLAEAFVIKGRYDAVISWNERLGLMFSLLLKLTGSHVPHVTIFSWISEKKKAEFLQRLHSNIDQIILMSSIQKDIAINRLHIPPSKITLLKWGVDQKFWRPMDVEPDMICSAGSEMRDYITLIETMRGLTISCHIAAGTQRNVMHPTIKAIWKNGAPPPNITVGRKGYAELRMLYARSRFVVIPILPSDSDHGTTSILEAMAMGKAVICSKTTGQVDVIQDGKTGLFVPQGDPAALREAIQYLWDNPDVALRMGNEGRKCVEKHYTLESFVSNVKRVVCDAVQQKQQSDTGKQARATNSADVM